MTDYDIEKQTGVKAGAFSSSTSLEYPPQGSVEDIVQTHPDNLFFRILNNLKAEIRGIDRVPEEEQTDNSIWNAASMWFSANFVIASFALGGLGVSVFQLHFIDSLLTIIFFNILGMAPVAFYSCFGPKFGLRQMVLSRYWFGYQGVRFLAFFNCIACIGWGTVNTIVSAQMLHTVNNGGLPVPVAIVIVSILTFCVSFMGYHFIHYYEKWAWVPNAVVFLIIAIQMGRSHAFEWGTMDVGTSEAASVLSFGGAVFGFATGWCPSAADYTVYMPKKTSSVKIFCALMLGLGTPLICVMTLGAACMTGIRTTPRFAAGYDANGIGGLVFEILVTDSLHGFGQFCVVVLALSTVANNIPNMYSLGLSAQTIWSKFKLVPRAAWAILGNGAVIGISIAAYYAFEEFIDNFMNIIGYWLAVYTAINMSAHFFWIGGFKNYNPDIHKDHTKLPVSYAAMFSFCVGIAGAVLGMDQVWYIGPIAKLIGGGADIGFEIAFGFAFVSFNFTRWLELRFLGR
ncbi:Purine-cytosine permease FCY2 [Yarrowia sp. C11]|nr:Purine-cytosine permease FCY2 [Yarrowia sp. E02]KAG5371329.1 Purine-cytosine permease FCY2 [Yarrowia sp. C11]